MSDSEKQPLNRTHAMKTAAERYDEAMEALRDRVFIGNEMAFVMRQLGIAMIEAAVARERARCLAILDEEVSFVKQKAIELGDEP